MNKKHFIEESKIKDFFNMVSYNIIDSNYVNNELDGFDLSRMEIGLKLSDEEKQIVKSEVFQELITSSKIHMLKEIKSGMTKFYIFMNNYDSFLDSKLNIKTK